MNEQLANQLFEALSKQTQALQEQTIAITRMADSNEMLCSLIVQAMNEGAEEEVFTSQTYLNGKPMRD